MMMDRPSFCSSHVAVVQYYVWLSVHKRYSTYSEYLHAEVYQLRTNDYAGARLGIVRMVMCVFAPSPINNNRDCWYPFMQ